MKIVVVGGGISGLTATWHLRKAGHDVHCIEPSARPGGLMRTEQREGFLCEAGPEAILDGAADTRALIEALGLTDEVVKATPAARRRFVYLRGKLRPVPSDPFSLVSTDLLSAAGKWRLLREPWVRPRPANDPNDESVFEFGARRLGLEAARNIVAPATIGIFAGDAARLSIKSAFPRLHALEARHGSLMRGLRAMRKDGGSPGRAFSFRDGLERLPQALASALGGALVRGEARRLARDPSGGWRIELRATSVSGAEETQALTADSVVLATPSRVTADLLRAHAPDAAEAVRGILLAPAAIVCLGYRTRELGVDLDAYGFLVAREEGPRLLGCQYESSVFPGRAPEGGVLLRAILGGTFDPGVAEEDEASLLARARADLTTVTGLRAPPDFTAVFRTRQAIPQYELGHEERVSVAEQAAAQLPGLHLLGYALRGVGVNDCIRNAAALARRLGAAS